MPWIHATDIITILSKGQGDGENQGSISSIFVPDHSVVRWPGANVSVWCVFPAHRHSVFLLFHILFYHESQNST